MLKKKKLLCIYFKYLRNQLRFIKTLVLHFKVFLTSQNIFINDYRKKIRKCQVPIENYDLYFKLS